MDQDIDCITSGRTALSVLRAIPLFVGRECAACHLEFRGRWAWTMVWCPRDRRYLCQRCYKDVCKPVHGEKPALSKAYRMVGIGALVVFGSGLLPFGLFLILAPTEPGASGDNATFGFALVALVLAGVVWIGLSLGLRRILHARAVRGHLPLPPEAFAEAPDPGVSWRPNRPAAPRRVAVLLSILVAAAVLDFVLLIFAPTIPTVSAATVRVVVIFATVIGAAAGLLAALPFPIPAAIAFKDDGIHFWYDSPVERRCARDLLPWVDLNLLVARTPGNVNPAVRLARYLRIDPENAKILEAEWTVHRIDRSATSPTAISKAPAPPTVPHPWVAPIEGNVAASQRGAVCARCRVRFPAIEGLRLLWCKVDRFFVCRRCWREGCREGHGRGMKAVSKTSRLVVVLPLAVGLLAVWYPGVAYDYALTNAWHAAPAVLIDGLHPGEIAKVFGTIGSSRLIAWGGHERYSSGRGWWWDWNSTDTFDLTDTSGSTIAVTTQAYYIVYDGPHPAFYAQHTDMRVYERGDIVQIVGTVIRTVSGVLALEAQIVLSAEWVASISIEPSAADVVLPILIPLVIAALGMGGGTILFTRRRRTRKALSGSPVLTLGDSGAARDPELSWQPNGRGTDPRRRGFVSLAFVLVGASLLLAYQGLGPRAGFGYWNLGFLGTIVVLVVGAAVGMLLFGGVGRPSFVAVAADGFRLWYDSPYDRHLNDTVFPWDEIVDIHMTSGKGAHWVLRRTTGEFTNLYMLKGRNLNLLLKEWATRRTPSGS